MEVLKFSNLVPQEKNQFGTTVQGTWYFLLVANKIIINGGNCFILTLDVDALQEDPKCSLREYSSMHPSPLLKGLVTPADGIYHWNW